MMASRARAPRLWRRGFAKRGRNWIGSKNDVPESSPEKLKQIATEVKLEAKRLGLGLVGITSPRASSRFDKYKEWLENNYHGELDYMEREDRIARRQTPEMILPGAKAVIMVGMHYWPGRSGFPEIHDPKLHGKRGNSGGETRGIVSCYAWGEDYHEILGKRIKELGRRLNEVAGGIGRFYVDTGAILERDFAERAGLGFVGKNSLLINPRSGSGFFIGELFTTLQLPYDGDKDYGTEKRGRGEPGCGKCTKCRVACPTGAIVEDFVVDARRCISYLTIELKGDIPEELRPGMGNRIYGCDICQQVCPWNRIEWEREDRATKTAFSPLFGRPSDDVTAPSLKELLTIDEEGFREWFKGSAVRRIGRERLARNAAVGLGNVGGVEDVQVLREVCRGHDSEMVREHAKWALDRIEQRMRDDVSNR